MPTRARAAIVPLIFSFQGKGLFSLTIFLSQRIGVEEEDGHVDVYHSLFFFFQ
jgi:hypothetical protein